MTSLSYDSYCFGNSREQTNLRTCCACIACKACSASHESYNFSSRRELVSPRQAELALRATLALGPVGQWAAGRWVGLILPNKIYYFSFSPCPPPHVPLVALGVGQTKGQPAPMPHVALGPGVYLLSPQ